MILPYYAPRDLPDLRIRMTEFLREYGASWLDHIFASVPALREGTTPDELASVAPAALDTLQNAELIHLDQHISQVVFDSGLRIYDYGFMPWDLPAPQGMLYIGHNQLDARDGPALILAWSTRESTDEFPDGYADLFVFLDKRMFKLNMLERVGPEALGQDYDDLQSDYILSEPMKIQFADNGSDVGFWGAADDRQIYVEMLFSACHLMRQPVINSDDQPVDRGARRRHQKAGLEPPQVRTVSLRRSERPEATGESSKEWHHRWVVRGHWRRQPYPSLGIVRPIWIAPFVKGPEDAPLLGGEKVYTVTDNTPK